MRGLLLSLFMFGFSFFATAQVSLMEAKKDTTVIVVAPVKGSTLTVTLSNYGGTAYSWKAPKNQGKVWAFEKEEQRNTYKPKEGEPPMTGTPYLTDFVFKFTGTAGTEPLKFSLESFSGDVSRAITYTVVVKPQGKVKKKKK